MISTCFIQKQTILTMIQIYFFLYFFFIEKLNLSEFQIDSWLINIADQYPTLAKVESIGSSHEGRDMKLIRVNKPQQLRRY